MASTDPAITDPFFRALRQRHPDVDVVMLPPQPTTPPGLPAAGVEDCLASAHHVDEVLGSLLVRLEGQPGRRLAFWWEQDHPLVRRRVAAATLTGLEDGVEALRRLGDALLELGWDTRPVGDDPPRLRAVAGPVEVRASAGGDRLSVEVVGGVLHVPPDVRDALADADLREQERR